MAKRTDGMMTLRRAPRRGDFPWEQWADGSWWLIYDNDLPNGLELRAFRDRCYTAASRRSMKVETHFRLDEAGQECLAVIFRGI